MMPDFYDTKCTHCGHTEKRYKNVKHCRKCGNLIVRVLEPDKKDAEIARLRQLISDLKEDGERAFDWCDHSDDCRVFKGGMNCDPECDCGYEELRTLHAALMEKIEKAGL